MTYAELISALSHLHKDWSEIDAYRDSEYWDGYASGKHHAADDLYADVIGRLLSEGLTEVPSKPQTNN